MTTDCPICDDFRTQIEALGSVLSGQMLKSGRPPRKGTARWLRFNETLGNQVSTHAQWLAHEREAHREMPPVMGALQMPSQCGQCGQFIGMLTYDMDTKIDLETVLSCTAFPAGIPQAVISGGQHCQPYTGDQGIKVELVE